MVIRYFFESPGNPELCWSDGLWYSLVTMTTVGYGDFFPETAAGRFLVGLPLMLVGIGLLGYALSVIATVLVTAKNKEIKGMSNFKGEGHLVIINHPSPWP
ncbi:MAG: potassium channel family protein [Desulfobulbaceae bacterium]